MKSVSNERIYVKLLLAKALPLWPVFLRPPIAAR